MATAPDPDRHAAPQLPATLALEHPRLAALSDLVFRRSPVDGAAIATLPMGAGPTGISLTLPALCHQFGIDAASADGRMLSAIAESLGYVSTLRAGDRLPAEVKTGEASWTADPVHLLRAASRLRLRLVAWHHHGSLEAGPRMEALLDRLANDPQLPHLVTAALRRIQVDLGMPTPEAFVARVDALAWELSFIEALRDRLLLRLQAIASTIEAATSGHRKDRQRGDMQVQVRRLLNTAIAESGQRFTGLDAQCADVIGLLRDAPAYRATIRAGRDGLYRTLRALEPMLDQWDNTPRGIDDGFWSRMATAYRTLAPRYMATQQWQRGSLGPGPRRP